LLACCHHQSIVAEVLLLKFTHDNTIPSVAWLLLQSHCEVTTFTLAVRRRLIVAFRNDFLFSANAVALYQPETANTTVTVRTMHNCACDTRLLAVPSPVTVPMCLHH